MFPGPLAFAIMSSSLEEVVFTLKQLPIALQLQWQDHVTEMESQEGHFKMLYILAG